MLSTAIDTRAAADWYRRNRQRSEALFDLIDPAAYYTRPISLRNPIVFYEGHLPAFSVLAFLRRGLGRASVDAQLEKLFERGIDPDSLDAAVPRSGATTIWPSRDEVRAFARACDEAVLAALDDMPSTPEAIEGLYTALEHEAMHQETLLYMWHRLPYDQKRRPSMSDVRWPMTDVRGPRSEVRGPRSEVRGLSRGSATVPAGTATLGADRDAVLFGWDNEFDRHIVTVPTFDIDTLPVTNAQYLEFVVAEKRRYPAFWIASSSPGLLSSSEEINWRGMFEALPFPADSPVYVSQEDAAAYAQWKGRRLMTEAEWHRAAEGATAGHADFAGFDPVAVGSYPRAASIHGVHDLIGNGWEWTSTIFGPFEGFAAMRSYPEYSADFFDGEHYVMKGASPATAKPLIRPSFRNWFRGNYPYVYAKFRTVR